MTKTESLTLRLSPRIKDALRVIAEIENRSITNTIEMLVIAYLTEKGLNIAND
jgi:hypothetical protein